MSRGSVARGRRRPARARTAAGTTTAASRCVASRCRRRRPGRCACRRASRHPARPACRRRRRRGPPADGRRRQPGRRRRRARARHPHRVHRRARPARRHPVARPGRAPDPAELRGGRRRRSTSGSAPGSCSGSPPTPRTPCCSRGRSCSATCASWSASTSRRTRSGTRSCRRASTSSSIDRAVAEAQAHAAGGEPTAALAELRALVDALPTERRALPLIVSVGRLHRVKGMATLVQAWARRRPARPGQPARRRWRPRRTRRPTSASSWTSSTPSCPPPSAPTPACCCPGHRPNDVVARWVAAARTGLPGLQRAAAAIYVCASLKEEFGIALLEAMASGLVVVAPDGGGPATYVDEGVTGFLTATWHADRSRAAIGVRARRRRSPRRTTGVPTGRRATVARAASPSSAWPARSATSTDGSRPTRSRPGRPGRPRMTLLIISPDYASHLLPLAALGTAWRDAGERVVVASGPATAGIVGVVRLRARRPAARPRVQPRGDPGRGAARRRGATRCAGSSTPPGAGWCRPSRTRRGSGWSTCMWRPVEKARATLDVVEAVRPDADPRRPPRVQRAPRRCGPADVPLRRRRARAPDGPAGRRRGLRHARRAWPRAFHPDPDELAELRRAVPTGAPPASRPSGTRPAPSSTPGQRAGGRRLRPARSARALQLPRGSWRRPSAQRALPPHRYLGSAACAPSLPTPRSTRGSRDAEPFVYVSFGSFLSVRSDVLRTVVVGAARGGRAGRDRQRCDPGRRAGRAARRAGSCASTSRRCVCSGRRPLLVTHGGNNSVTEAVGTATPMLVLPFSTDQFAGAAAIERAGVGEVLDPNRASVRRGPRSAPAAAGSHGRRRGAARGCGRFPRSGPGARQSVPRGRRLGDQLSHGGSVAGSGLVARHEASVCLVLGAVARCRDMMQRVHAPVCAARAAARASSRARGSTRRPRSPSRGTARPGRRGRTTCAGVVTVTPEHAPRTSSKSQCAAGAPEPYCALPTAPSQRYSVYGRWTACAAPAPSIARRSASRSGSVSASFSTTTPSSGHAPTAWLRQRATLKVSSSVSIVRSSTSGRCRWYQVTTRSNASSRDGLGLQGTTTTTLLTRTRSVCDLAPGLASGSALVVGVLGAAGVAPADRGAVVTCGSAPPVHRLSGRSRVGRQRPRGDRRRGRRS